MNFRRARYSHLSWVESLILGLMLVALVVGTFDVLHGQPQAENQVVASQTNINVIR